MKSQFNIQGNFQLVWPIFFLIRLPITVMPHVLQHMSPSYFCSCWQSTCVSSHGCGGGKGTINVPSWGAWGPHTNSNNTPTATAHTNTFTVGTNCSVTWQAGSLAQLTERGRAPTTVEEKKTDHHKAMNHTTSHPEIDVESVWLSTIA